jgi:hypothetical protein
LEASAAMTNRLRTTVIVVAPENKTPTLRSAVPNWEIGDKIPFGPDKPALLVVGIRNAGEPRHRRFQS